MTTVLADQKMLILRVEAPVLVQTDRPLCSLTWQMRITYTQNFPRLTVAAKEYIGHETMVLMMQVFSRQAILFHLWHIASTHPIVNYI